MYLKNIRSTYFFIFPGSFYVHHQWCEDNLAPASAFQAMNPIPEYGPHPVKMVPIIWIYMEFRY